MLTQKNLSIEDISYQLIIKENSYFILNKFTKPSVKNYHISINNLDFHNLYNKKFLKLKKKVINYWKFIKEENLINNLNIEYEIQKISIILLKNIKKNSAIIFKFDKNIISKIFKIILKLTLNNVNFRDISTNLIESNFKDRNNYSQTELTILINKFILFLNIN